MKIPIHLFLIDNTPNLARSLKRQIARKAITQFSITRLSKESFFESSRNFRTDSDIVLLSEKLTESETITITSKIRCIGNSVPIIRLTRVSEAKLSRKLSRAGVDVMLNIADLKTPIFAWTLTSLLSSSESQRKGNGVPRLRDRVQICSQELAELAYKLNNELAAVRLAVHQLRSYDPIPATRAKLLSLIEKKLAQIEVKTNQVDAIGHRLGDIVPPFVHRVHADPSTHDSPDSG